MTEEKRPAPEAKRAYWLYEIQRGHGIFQGATGPGAEGIVRRVTQGDPNVGQPFVAYCFPGSPSALELYEADYKDARKAGFESPGEVLSAYKTLEKKHDWCADRLKKAEDLLQSVLDAGDFPSLRELIEEFVKD